MSAPAEFIPHLSTLVVHFTLHVSRIYILAFDVAFYSLFQPNFVEWTASWVADSRRRGQEIHYRVHSMRDHLNLSITSLQITVPIHTKLV